MADNIWDKISRDIDAQQGLNPELPADAMLTQGIGNQGLDADFSPDQGLSVGLPPNTAGGDVANQVDAATIGQFSPNGQVMPDTDVQFIQQQLDPLGGAPLALGDVAQQEFTPGMNLPLAVGGTSGQLTGSRNIFVAQNQAVPFALMERRRAAQQQAAIKRAEDMNKFKLRKPPLSKDPRFNKNLVNTFNEYTDIFVERATQQFGSREAGLAALQNPGTKIGREYLQQMDNLDILAGEVDQIVDMQAKVDKSIEEGDQFVSPETQKLNEEFKSLTGRFSGGDPFGAASLRNIQDQLQTSQSVDQFFKENDVLKNIEGVILKRAGIDDSRADQFRTTTRYTENFEEGARAQAKAMKQNVAFRNREDLTEDDIFNRIMALKGRVDKRTATVKAKPVSKGFTDKSQVPVSDDPKIVKIGDNQFQTTTSVPFSQATQSKPVLATGVTTLDQNGNLSIRKGQVNFRPVEAGVITDKDGVKRRVLFAKEVVTTANLSKEEQKQYKDPVTGKMPKTVEKDIVVDYDNIENTMKGQSVDAKASVEAFSDVSGESKRQKQTIDESNFDAYKQKFIESGYASVREFNQAVKNSGIDIIMNEELKSRLIETSTKRQ